MRGWIPALRFLRIVLPLSAPGEGSIEPVEDTEVANAGALGFTMQVPPSASVNSTSFFGPVNMLCSFSDCPGQ